MLNFIFRIRKFLILIFAIVLIFIGISMITINKKEKISKDMNNSVQTAILPIIKLHKNISNGTAEEIIIYVNVSTEDDKGIDYIITPDGEKIEQNGEKNAKLEYKVTKNGTYTFKVVDENGNEGSESIEIANVEEKIALNPYIPENFEYVEGEVENGYVIEDELGNQYVWVPVEKGSMQRKKSADSKYFEDADCVSEFVNSVAKYCGFYIARYEASASKSENNVDIALTKKGEIPWTNIDYAEAYNISRSEYITLGYEDCYTALINSYAWETAIAWIDKNFSNYSSSDQFGNYSGKVKNTGETEDDEVNKICDMAGNVREWTTEGYKDINSEKDNNEIEIKSRILRGGSAATDRTASSYTAYAENQTDKCWGFRMILYK